MRYETPAAFRAALEARLKNAAAAGGVQLDRLRRRAVFERILARLEAGDPGKWVLKGGMALEVRWSDRARTTRDMDLAILEQIDDDAVLRDRLMTLLATDPDSDSFRFEVGVATEITADEAGRRGWRVHVRALLAGNTFASVRVDVVARPEEIAAVERIRLPATFAFAEIEGREIGVVAPSQHFAEKLHALTRDYGERESTRVRDLVDVAMLIEDGLDPAAARSAAEHVFAERATHDPPEDLAEPPEDWRARYSEYATELELEAATLDQAMASLRAFWRSTINTKEAQ
jgi:hypothetical protein